MKYFFLLLFPFSLFAQRVERYPVVTSLDSAEVGKRVIFNGVLYENNGDSSWIVIRRNLSEVVHRDSMVDPARWAERTWTLQRVNDSSATQRTWTLQRVNDSSATQRTWTLGRIGDTSAVQKTWTAASIRDSLTGARAWTLNRIRDTATAIRSSMQGGSDPWTYVKLAADFTTSNVAAQNSNLFFTPSANLMYVFEGTLLIRTATATVNPRVGLSWPTGLTDGVGVVRESQAATGTPLFASGNPGAALLVAVGGLPNNTTSWPVEVSGIVIAGASPSGVVRVQLASETSGTNVTIKAGSFIRYRVY